MWNDTGATGLSSVANAMRLLRCFSDADRELGIAAMAVRLGLAKSSVHRLAATLLEFGMLEQDPATARYRLGLTAFELGSLARRRMDIYAEARDVLHNLRDRTHETVNLAILRGADVVYLNSLESRTAVRATTPIGQRLAAIATAEGLVLLAHALEADGTADDGTADYSTATDGAAARAAIRAQGFATNAERTDIGMRAIAAPFFGADDEVLGAIGIAAPAQRVGRRALAAFLPLLLDATAALSARLGATSAILREAR